MKTCNEVNIRNNRDDPNLCIEIEAVETDHISTTYLPNSDKNINKKKFRYLRNVQLADCYEFNNKVISILLEVDYYYEVVTGRITRLNKHVVAVKTLFGDVLTAEEYNLRETFHNESYYERIQYFKTP
ncbi:DUF1758 domain-containing protein [Nephila pilipes]|uniref:DUF1758 domain-containing protein n=1 Tax=Nephila pilipes TaxID=299642 RepID=A0A8X6QBS7_NEPPI|nr:DUF1758 domain-containing protein [Nephila pilipes]